MVGPKGKAGARAAIRGAIAAALLVFGAPREKVEELEEVGTEATEGLDDDGDDLDLVSA